MGFDARRFVLLMATGVIAFVVISLVAHHGFGWLNVGQAVLGSVGYAAVCAVLAARKARRRAAKV